MSLMKYIECECCSFLAAIPKADSHEDLDCPFCKRVKCDHGGKFVEIGRDAFEDRAEFPRTYTQTQLLHAMDLTRCMGHDSTNGEILEQCEDDWSDAASHMEPKEGK